jgi:uncharacterized protein YggT (Ycf19 family)
VNLVDFILNLVAVLLWLNWRAVRLTAATQPSVLSLASALKRAEPRRPNRWLYFIALILLLLLRSLFYWQVGSSMSWTPAIQLGAISLHFRSDFFARMVLFSTFSFAVVLGICYLWLLLLVMVNRTVPESEPIQRIVRLQLGWIAHWPAALQLLLPMLAVAVLWLLCHESFVRLGLISAATSTSQLWQQALVLGAGSFLAWKYFVVGLLLAYTLNSYVYLGSSPVWNFVDATGRNLLWPLRWLPLGIGKADFAPVAGIALVLMLGRFGANWLSLLYR